MDTIFEYELEGERVALNVTAHVLSFRGCDVDVVPLECTLLHVIFRALPGYCRYADLEKTGVSLAGARMILGDLNKRIAPLHVVAVLGSGLLVLVGEE